jgi:hypothetical protein
MINDSQNFINQLNDEISCYEKIKKNATLYIKHNNLKKVKFHVSREYLRDKDLPSDILMGTLYLIKNNNIMYFYSYFDSCFSPYIKCSMIKKIWISVSDVVNMEVGDPENLNEIIKYYPTIRDSEYLGLVVLSYIMNKGFDLYIKDQINIELEPL